jgi:hypothetical protein
MSRLVKRLLPFLENVVLFLLLNEANFTAVEELGIVEREVLLPHRNKASYRGCLFLSMQREAAALIAQMPPRSGGTLPVVFHSSSAAHASSVQVPARESRRLQEQQVGSKKGEIIFNLTEKWIGRIYSGQFCSVKSSKAGLNLYWRKFFKKRPVSCKLKKRRLLYIFLSGRVEKAAG